MNDVTLKELLFDFCQDFVDDRKTRIESQMNEVKEALNSETKSSAGDKHETGRAMLQLEREKLGNQLVEVENMGRILQRVNISPRRTTAALGSLVKTNLADYFLAISAGEFQSGIKKCYCISLNTPIGLKLLGKTVGDIFDFQGKEIKILQVL